MLAATHKIAALMGATANMSRQTGKYRMIHSYKFLREKPENYFYDKTRVYSY